MWLRLDLKLGPKVLGLYCITTPGLEFPQKILSDRPCGPEEQEVASGAALTCPPQFKKRQGLRPRRNAG